MGILRLPYLFATLATQFTVVLYDRPGCGLSDRDQPALTLESQVRTLTSVIDHLSLQRCALFGFSQGGPPAVVYAFRQPERIAHLTLFATMARWQPPEDLARQAEVWEATKAMIRARWSLGASVLAQMSVPGGNVQTLDWEARLLRESVEPETAIAITEHYLPINVIDEASGVRVPTLVMHRRNDPAMPFERGRELAASIPNARFVPMDGARHALFEGEVQDVLQLTVAFLSDDPAPIPPSSGIQAAAHPDRLSSREVEVLQLIAAGKSNKEIANWLVISPNTVIRHVSNIFDKTGGANRAEGATYANRHGLVE